MRAEAVQRILWQCILQRDNPKLLYDLIAHLESFMISFKRMNWTCYKIAEGFRFMPLSLVRLRTFGSAHGLVRCNSEIGVNAGARGRMDVSLRSHNSPRRYWVTGCGWHHAPEARGGLYENLKKIRVGYLTPNEEDRLLELAGARRTCALWGPLELGAKWIRQHRMLCLSSLRRKL